MSRKTVSYPEILGRTIQQRRKELGLEQDVLSERSGIPQSTISRLERGEALLNSEQVSYLADALNLSPSDFWIRADKVKKAVEAKGWDIRRDRVTPELVKTSSALVTGAALTGLIFAVLAEEDI